MSNKFNKNREVKEGQFSDVKSTEETTETAQTTVNQQNENPVKDVKLDLIEKAYIRHEERKAKRANKKLEREAKKANRRPLTLGEKIGIGAGGLAIVGTAVGIGLKAFADAANRANYPTEDDPEFDEDEDDYSEPEVEEEPETEVEPETSEEVE